MRRRMTMVMAVLALVAGACGGDSTEDQFRQEMLDTGLTSEQVDCVVAALDDAGIGLSELSDQALGDADAPAAATRAMTDCVLGDLGLDSGGLDTGGLDSTDGPVDGPDTYGDDATLDALWDACDGGDDAACDDLYLQSPFGSGYEEFGDTCGGRNPSGGTFCAAEE